LNEAKFTKLPCQFCGRPISVKLDTRYNPPVPTTTAPFCKNPGVDFKIALESMSEQVIFKGSAKGLKELLENPTEELKKALKDTDFADQLERFKCCMSRKEQAERIKSTFEPIPREVSEDAVRNEGRKEDVETFEGLRTVDVRETNEGLEVDPERLRTSKSKNGKKPKQLKNTLDKPAQKRRQPSYLQTQAFPVIPTSDPQAPYGRDENDRPIGKMQPAPPVVLYTPPPSDEELLRKQKLEKWLERLAQAEKAQKENPRNEKIIEPISPQEQTENEREALLPLVNKFFFPEEKIIPLPNPAPNSVTREEEIQAELNQRADLNRRLEQLRPNEFKTHKYVSFREMLGLTREQIAGWFDYVLVQKYSEQRYKPDREGFQKKIRDCDEAIKGLEEEFKGMSAKVRGNKQLADGTPDPSYLDAATRSNYKAKFKRSIARLKKEKQAYKNAMRRKTDPAAKPVDPDDLSYTEEVLRTRDFTFGDLFYLHLTWLKRYKEAVELRAPVIPEDKNENEVIQYAIKVLPSTLCPRPSVEVIRKYPWIMKHTLPKFDFEPGENNGQEEKLIKKTSGSQIGGQIAAAPFYISKTGKFTRRALTDFDSVMDKPAREGISGGGDDRLEMDDAENPENYDPR